MTKVDKEENARVMVVADSKEEVIVGDGGGDHNEGGCDGGCG